MGELRELVDLRREAESLARDLTSARFRHAAGLPAVDSLPEIAARHGLACSRDGFAQAVEAHGNAVASDASPARLARLAALREFLVRARTLGLEPGAAQELLDLERRPSVRPPGDAGLHGAVPVVQVDRELPFEVHRDRRGELERALADAVSKQSSARSAAWDASQGALAELGLEPAAAAVEVQSRGWTSAAQDAEAFLRATDALAEDLGAWLVERHTGARKYPAGAERHDILYTVYSSAAAAFPRGEQLRTVRRWAEMLQLDPTEGGLIHLDDEERPLKRAGAAAFPIEPPVEIRVSWFPQPGPRALAALLGALGEALLLAGPPDDAPPEDRWLGDAAVRAASRSVLAWLPRDPLWLRRCAKADLGRDGERAIAYGDLLDARLQAASVLSSLEALGIGGLSSRAEAAARDLFARAARAEIPAALALRELDPWVSSWGRLRGLALAARLRAWLRERHDEDWWRNPRALAALRALWARGGRPTAPELWAELGEDKPSMEPLANELVQACY